MNRIAWIRGVGHPLQEKGYIKAIGIRNGDPGIT